MLNANSKVCPAISHIIALIKAIVITHGTNIPLTLSASLAIGAFELLASSTSFIICDIVVSLPTLVAFIFKYPFLFIVPDTTMSPTVFSTGMLSPVILDWSIDVLPSITIPSTPILEPGLIAIISPTTTSSSLISISFPSLITATVFGTRFISFSIAAPVFAFDLVSKYFPHCD